MEATETLRKRTHKKWQEAKMIGQHGKGRTLSPQAKVNLREAVQILLITQKN